MKRRFFCLLLVAAAATAGVPATSQAGPLGRLHDRLFGEHHDEKRDKKDKDKDKKKKKDKDRDDDHRHHSHRPQIHVYRSEPVYQREVHVYRSEPVYERRYETRYEAEPRRYYRPIEVDVQRALARRGYYNGPIDGDLGPGTRAAIRAYQYDHDLPVSGRIDRYLIDALRL